MAGAEAPLFKLPWIANRRQTDEEDLHMKARSKTVIEEVGHLRCARDCALDWPDPITRV